jgi:hypothetical protein
VEATGGCLSPLVVIGLLGLSFQLNAMMRRSPTGSLKKKSMANENESANKMIVCV